MAERIEQQRALGHDRTVVEIMFWCRSGHHRSVAMVEMLASVLDEARALARSTLRGALSACVVHRSLVQPLAMLCLFACSACFVRVALLLACLLCLLRCVLVMCFDSLRVALRALARSLALLLDCLRVCLRACMHTCALACSRACLLACGRALWA